MASKIIVDTIETTTGKQFLKEGNERTSTIATLRAMTAAPLTIWASGYYAENDGAFGSNIYSWNAASTEADNGGTVIKLATIATGRYELQYKGKVSVTWFGATGDGATDDKIAIQTAIDNFSALHIPKGVYAFSGTLVIPTAGSFQLSGDGENDSILKYTGTDFHGIRGVSLSYVNFSGLTIKYTNSGFAGNLVSMKNTARGSFERCVLIDEATVYPAVSTADILLDLDDCIEFDISRVRLSGANYLLRGSRDNALGFCNAISITGSDFDRYNIAAIRNVGEAWAVSGNAFENGNNGIGGIAIANHPSNPALGLTFSGNWMGDAIEDIIYSWITISGTGIEISGNYMNGHGFNKAIAVTLNNTTNGLIFEGNRVSSMNIGIATGAGVLTNSTIRNNANMSVTSEITGTYGETVDDGRNTYSSGVWTPLLKFAENDTGVTYSSNTGTYIKVGKLIHVTFDFTLTSKGTDTGGAGIYGLPFTSSPVLGQGIGIDFYINMGVAVTFSNRVESDSTSISLGQQTAVITQPVPDTSFTNTTRITGSGYYACT